MQLYLVSLLPRLIIGYVICLGLLPTTQSASLPNEWEILLSKKIVIENKHEGYDLALDTFERSLASDMTGDSWYFIFLIHYYRKAYDHDISQYIAILEKSKVKDNALAISTMYVIYSRPYLVSAVDIKKTNELKREYQSLVKNGNINIAFDVAVNTSIKLLGLH